MAQIPQLPPIVFGSSALGNLYSVVPEDTKRAIVENWIRHQDSPLIDSAGKYGAGLALETIGRLLDELGVDPAAVRISNKLGWKRVPLSGDEPTFEKGVWFGLEHDAEAVISYDGILECYRQGNELLDPYGAHLLSVHDPDEYVAAAATKAERETRFGDVLDAYRALGELKRDGRAAGIGVGAKDWRMIERLYRNGAPFDWVMFANSYTIFRHPPEILEFMSELEQAGVAIVNSAVFNAGFLLGGAYFDYRKVTADEHPELFAWRDGFHRTCRRWNADPAHVCCQFALSPPGVNSLALNTSRPERVADLVRYVTEPVPGEIWTDLVEDALISQGADPRNF